MPGLKQAAMASQGRVGPTVAWERRSCGVGEHMPVQPVTGTVGSCNKGLELVNDGARNYLHWKIVTKIARQRAILSSACICRTSDCICRSRSFCTALVLRKWAVRRSGTRKTVALAAFETIVAALRTAPLIAVLAFVAAVVVALTVDATLTLTLLGAVLAVPLGHTSASVRAVGPRMVGEARVAVWFVPWHALFDESSTVVTLVLALADLFGLVVLLSAGGGFLARSRGHALAVHHLRDTWVGVEESHRIVVGKGGVVATRNTQAENFLAHCKRHVVCAAGRSNENIFECAYLLHAGARFVNVLLGGVGFNTLLDHFVPDRCHVVDGRDELHPCQSQTATGWNISLNCERVNEPKAPALRSTMDLGCPGRSQNVLYAENAVGLRCATRHRKSA
jgi:hypothetical protein